MNNVSLTNVQVKPKNPSNYAAKAKQQVPIAFTAAEKGDRFDEAADAAKKVIDEIKSDPDKKTIKAGLAAILTVAGLYIAKSAAKIEKFVKTSQKSSNKFVKALGVAAGLVLSLLSILGASSLFKEKVDKAKQEEETQGAPEFPQAEESAPETGTDKTEPQK